MKKLNMNRTYSHCLRTFSQSKKTTIRPSINYQFRTLHKFRDNHRTCEKPKESISSNINLKKVQQLPHEQVYQTAAQQQMRQFIKVMKNQNKAAIIINSSVQQSSNSNIQPCQTSRSTQSKLSLSNINSTRLGCSIVQHQPIHDQQQQNLEEIEKKVDELIRMKISKKAHFRSRQLLSASNKDSDLEKGLRSLVEQVQKYSIAKKNNNCVDVDIKDIRKKISIYEKALASTCTENQILKRMYSSTQKIRKNFAVLGDRSQSQLRSLSTSQKFLLPSPPSIQMETTTRSHFIKPSQNSYVAKENKKPSYLLNRQPFPRSLYQRQFLYYGIVPTYSANIKAQKQVQPQQNQNVFSKMQGQRNKSEAQNRPTQYTKQYKQKHALITNSKELDCREDKFKNVNMSFMPKKKGPWKGKPPTFQNLNKNQPILLNKSGDQWLKYSLSPPGKENDSYFYETGKTQHQSQYKLPFSPAHCPAEDHHSAQPECLMKQKNLNHLKYTYKYQYSYV